jgi:hypothetical protein
MGQICYSNKRLWPYPPTHSSASPITPKLSNALAMTETLFMPRPFIFRMPSGMNLTSAEAALHTATINFFPV